MNVLYCHNPLCSTALALEPGIRLHQERETGAWVPDDCPACGGDLHRDSLSEAVDGALRAVLGHIDEDPDVIDLTDMLRAIGREADRQRQERIRLLAAHRASDDDAQAEPVLDLDIWDQR